MSGNLFSYSNRRSPFTS